MYHRSYDEDTTRLGLRVTPDTSNTVLLSVIHSDRDEKKSIGQNTIQLPCVALPPTWPFPCADVPIPGFFTVTTDQNARADRETYQYEGQYIFQADRYNITTGALYADNDTGNESMTTSTISYPLPPTNTPLNQDNNTYVSSAYVYSNMTLMDSMVWTAGVGYSDATINYKNPIIEDEDYNRFNPKLGVRWELTDDLDLRAAYLRTVMPLLANKRLLEPTQVAGFNQYYDEAAGTKAETYGGGLDWRPASSVALGGEMIRRDLETPTTLIDTQQNIGYMSFDDRDEWRNRAYAYWMPTDRWSFGAEVIYDKFESDPTPVNINLPEEVRTWSYPLTVNYFHPSGLFGMVGATYVDQKVVRQPLAQYAQGEDDFVVTDLAVGYRLPRRQGILSLAVQNVFDQNFDYQDDSYRTFEDEPTVGPYIPDRSIMARVTLNF
jgi:hypothetical protein